MRQLVVGQHWAQPTVRSDPTRSAILLHLEAQFSKMQLQAFSDFRVPNLQFSLKNLVCRSNMFKAQPIFYEKKVFSKMHYNDPSRSARGPNAVQLQAVSQHFACSCIKLQKKHDKFCIFMSKITLWGLTKINLREHFWSKFAKIKINLWVTMANFMATFL